MSSASIEADLGFTTPLGCQPWQQGELSPDDGVSASIRCARTDGAVSRLELFTYSGADPLRTRWLADLDAIDPPLTRESAACEGSVAGKRKWGFGSIACSAGPEGASIRWTDGRNRMYGVVESSDDDITQLFDWWRKNARSLGRIVERAPQVKPDPVPRSAAPRLRQVPGAPKSFVCGDLEEPLRDMWDRKWRVRKVNFFTENRYERVVIQLERTGSARKGTPTSVDVKRVPASKLRQVVPQAPRPTKGRTSLVVDMQGVRDAPDLRAYRPKGMGVVKELSIVRNDGSRTAVIAVAGDGCYVVRAPIWGPSATGDETTAQIYIDIKR